MKRWIPGILLASLLSCGSLLADSHTFQYQKILEVGDNAAVTLSAQTGRIEIVGHDAPTIVIDAVKCIKIGNRKEAEEVADHIEIRVDQDRNKVRIAANYLPIRERGQSFWQKMLGRGKSDSFGSVDFIVRVPRACHVDIDNLDGAIIVHELDGNISIRTSSEDVTLAGIEGAVTVKSAAANIRLTSIEGSVDVANGAGSIAGEMLFGPVTVRQPTGKIDLLYIEGDIRVKSTSADMKIRQERGALDVATVTGSADIQTTLESSRDLYVETESGDITLMLPREASGTLHVKSETGTIKTELPVTIDKMSARQLVGTLGAGGIHVTLVSLSGDVTVAQF